MSLLPSSAPSSPLAAQLNLFSSHVTQLLQFYFSVGRGSAHVILLCGQRLAQPHGCVVEQVHLSATSCSIHIFYRLHGDAFLRILHVETTRLQRFACVDPPPPPRRHVACALIRPAGSFSARDQILNFSHLCRFEPSAAAWGCSEARRACRGTHPSPAAICSTSFTS